jgi:hypothetical protein
MTINTRFIFLFGLIVLLLSSCERRFWYRKKIKAPPPAPELFTKPKTIDVEVQNYSPESISKHFEMTIRQTSLNELLKNGFIHVSKDTPNYTLVIFLKVDSYYVYGHRTGAIGGNNYHSIISKNKLNGPANQGLQETNIVKELAFTYRLISLKTGNLYWESDDGLYFFSKERKDLRRSVGLVKYALENIR